MNEASMKSTGSMPDIGNALLRPQYGLEKIHHFTAKKICHYSYRGY